MQLACWDIRITGYLQKHFAPKTSNIFWIITTITDYTTQPSLFYTQKSWMKAQSRWKSTTPLLREQKKNLYHHCWMFLGEVNEPTARFSYGFPWPFPSISRPCHTLIQACSEQLPQAQPKYAYMCKQRYQNNWVKTSALSAASDLGVFYQLEIWGNLQGAATWVPNMPECPLCWRRYFNFRPQECPLRWTALSPTLSHVGHLSSADCGGS